MFVKQGEVLGHDGDGEGDHQGPRDGADGADHPANVSLGSDVTIAEESNVNLTIKA